MLRYQASTARDTGLIPGQETKIPHTVQHDQNKKKKKKKEISTKFPMKILADFFFFFQKLTNYS